MAPKLTKLMQKALQEAPETTKFETIQKLAKMGVVTIKDWWILRRGLPGASATGSRPGRFVVIFEINHQTLRELGSCRDQSSLE